MKKIMSALSLLWSLLVIGVVVNAGVWLVFKGVALIADGFSRVFKRNKI